MNNRSAIGLAAVRCDCPNAAEGGPKAAAGQPRGRDFVFAPRGSLANLPRATKSLPGCNEREACTLRGDTTGSVAGVPAAVLAEIGCRALRAVNGRRTIIIGEGARQEPWPVIMLEADFVRQRIKV